MSSFKQEITAYLKIHDLLFKDNLSSYKRLDFTFSLQQTKFHLIALEKMAAYQSVNWNIPPESEPDAYLLEDLIARKILAYAPYSGLAVKVHPTDSYYFFSVADLFLMPKKRQDRPAFDHKKFIKGEWMIDLKNGKKCASMNDLFLAFEEYILQKEQLFVEQTACYGTYQEGLISTMRS